MRHTRAEVVYSGSRYFVRLTYLRARSSPILSNFIKKERTASRRSIMRSCREADQFCAVTS